MLKMWSIFQSGRSEIWKSCKSRNSERIHSGADRKELVLGCGDRRGHASNHGEAKESWRTKAAAPEQPLDGVIYSHSRSHSLILGLLRKGQRGTREKMSYGTASPFVYHQQRRNSNHTRISWQGGFGLSLSYSLSTFFHLGDWPEWTTLWNWLLCLKPLSELSRRWEEGSWVRDHPG